MTPIVRRIVMGTMESDTISGGDGDQVIRGGRGDDQLAAYLGNDTVTGGGGDDMIVASLGEHKIWGGRGSDTIIATEGKSRLAGGWGDDFLVLAGGNSKAFGGRGDDWLVAQASPLGSASKAFLGGGAGHDTFVFTLGHENAASKVVIRDFDADHEHLVFRLPEDTFGSTDARYTYFMENAEQRGAHVVFDDPNGGTLKLRNTDLDDLSMANFMDATFDAL